MGAGTSDDSQFTYTGELRDSSSQGQVTTAGTHLNLNSSSGYAHDDDLRLQITTVGATGTSQANTTSATLEHDRSDFVSDATDIHDTLPAGIDPLGFYESFRDDYSNAGLDLPAMRIGYGGGAGKFYDYSRTHSQYQATNGNEERHVDQVQDLAFSPTGLMVSSSSGSVSTESHFDFSQAVTVQSGSGVMGGSDHGEGSEAQTLEAGTVDALTFYFERAELHGDGEIDAGTLTHDDNHTISTAYSTDVTSGTWAYQDESFSKYHSGGTRDDQQLSEDSTHVNIAALTGDKTAETGKLRTYITDDQSTFVTTLGLQSGPATPVSGRTVGQGDWGGSGDNFGMKYIAGTEGFHNQLDTGTLDLQTTKINGGAATNTVDVDTRTRDEHQFDRHTVHLDFDLSFGSSGGTGGLKLHQDQFIQTDHFNHSVYNHGTRTVHDYTEDFDSGTTTQMAMGMDEADFAMDVYVVSVRGEHRHTDGHIGGERITGRRNAATVTDVSFSTAGLDFQFHNHDWSIVDPYDIQHTPGRNFWNQRTSTNQDYQAFHVHRGTDTTRSLTNAAYSNYNSSSDTHTEIVTDLASTGGTNTGQTVNSDHSWGSTTDSSGTTTPYDSLQDGVAGQQDERTPLWITDAALQPPAMGGAGLGWQALDTLLYVPGANVQAVAQAWSAGQEAVGGTTGTSGWTLVDAGQLGGGTINGTYHADVWYQRFEAGNDSWRVDYYDGDPANGGILFFSDSGSGPNPFASWEAGDAHAHEATTPTPADEADNEAPPTPGAPASPEAADPNTALDGLAPGAHAEQEGDRSLENAAEQLDKATEAQGDTNGRLAKLPRAIREIIEAIRSGDFRKWNSVQLAAAKGVLLGFLSDGLGGSIEDVKNAAKLFDKINSWRPERLASYGATLALFKIFAPEVYESEVARIQQELQNIRDGGGAAAANLQAALQMGARLLKLTPDQMWKLFIGDVEGLEGQVKWTPFFRPRG